MQSEQSDQENGRKGYQNQDIPIFSQRALKYASSQWRVIIIKLLWAPSHFHCMTGES